MNTHLEPQTIERFDALSDERRSGALAHVRDCAACRAAWLAVDASRLFALLSQGRIPEDALERLSARVDAEVDRLEPGVPVARRWFAVASFAASLLLAGVLGPLVWNHELAVGSLALSNEVAQPALEDEFAGIKLVSSPGDEARVLDLNIGETQVLMIFDESIEL